MTDRNNMRPLVWLLLSVCLAGPVTAYAQPASFVVREIEVVGLQRITEGTLFNYLPVNIGDELTPSRVQQSIRSLFATEFFRDVELLRDGDKLIVNVVERPTIALFAVEGNKDIKDKELRDVMRGIGLAEGRIFNRSVLDGVETELRRQYFANGKYAMTVETTITDLANNTVAIKLVISEGKAARIQRINFIGNDSFSDDELRDALELKEPNWLSWYRKDDQYSREKLRGDLETLRSYYMDRGYADFDVDSVQVAISPDRRDMYVTINVREGDQYTFGDSLEISGKMVVPEEQLRALIVAQPGQPFSLRRVTESGEYMGMRLGESGYANAEITPIPELNKEHKTVDIVFYVEPGQRVYVRRIEFTGAESINDETLRREMRQLEGTWMSTSALERSKVRLQRLPYIEEVELESVPVPGSSDLVDVEVTTKTRTPGDFNFGLGYSEAYGLIVNAGITHANFLGEGKRVRLDLSRSEFSESYVIDHNDPYWTVDGISRSVGIFYRNIDQLFAQGAPLFMNTVGANLSFGIPLSEYSYISVGASVRDTEVVANLASSTRFIDWVTNPNHGDNFEHIDIINPFNSHVGTRFKTLELTGGWAHDTRNRSIFATRGSLYSVSAEIAVPPSEIKYFVGTALNERYFPITDSLTYAYKAEANVATGIGSTESAPPYKVFFVGGPDTVRGFREHWLGPKDSTGRPDGGNIRFYMQNELILPVPMERLKNSSRFSLFVDVGSVFRGRDNVDLDELRVSAGVSATWLAPLGAMKFSIAFPVRHGPDDQVERFQFTLGSSF